jgi:segregation and condensation protein B
MEHREAQSIMESLLFITEQPIPLKAFEDLFDKEFSREVLQKMAEDLAFDYQTRGSALELREIAGGWQFSSRPEFAPWIRKLFKDRLTYRLSNSAMETLSIVAYKQPITRSEIEEIRGVEVSAVLDTLVERRLVKIVGRKESVGRPLLYGTTPEFLKSFGLKRLDALPTIDSLTPQTLAEQEELLLETKLGAAPPAAPEETPLEPISEPSALPQAEPQLESQS